MERRVNLLYDLLIHGEIFNCPISRTLVGILRNHFTGSIARLVNCNMTQGSRWHVFITSFTCKYSTNNSICFNLLGIREHIHGFVTTEEMLM